MRRKDCVGEVQIVERTTSIKEVVRSFAENLAFECRVCGRGGGSAWQARAEWDEHKKERAMPARKVSR